MRVTLRASLLGVLALSACNNPPAANDSGNTTTDSGPPMLHCPTSSSTVMIPDDTHQTLPCCYRTSQADHPSMAELRLRFLNITAPAHSGLVSTPTQSLLNASLTNETFNWLIRANSGAGDGPITIQTGFGTRNDAANTYAFTTMAHYAPITLNGTITGQTVTTQPDTGTLVVPVFDPTGMTLEVELALHNVQVVTSTFSENRSCIGALAARGFTTAATLSGFLTVSDTRGSMINVSPINAQLCTLVASTGFTEPASGHYCDAPQAMWAVKPDSLCPATGQCMHDPGDGSVCSHDGTGATACNAWQLVADFAAVGVDINP